MEASCVTGWNNQSVSPYYPAINVMSKDSYSSNTLIVIKAQ